MEKIKQNCSEIFFIFGLGVIMTVLTIALFS